MNKILNNTIIMVLFLLFCAISGCRKMEGTYKEFVVPGGLTYTGKVTSPSVSPGHNRLKISWLRGADPTVINAKIFWNNYADSLIVPIPSMGDTISVIINNLVEKSYSFIIRTYDAKGNSSIPVEVIGGSYGDKYQAQLLNRPVNSTMIDAKGKATIQWGSADLSNGAYASEVLYTDTLNNVKSKSFPTDVATSVISDIKPGTSYQFRTVFRPDSSSIDDFYTGYSQSAAFNFDKTDWSVAGYSDQYSDDNGVQFIIDGIPEATRWHTNGSAYPHWATIDMKAVRTVTRFGVWRTDRDAPGGDSRAPTRIQFLISMDNQTWTDLGQFDFNNLLSGEQSFVMPPSSTGRYFKFVGLAGQPGNDHYMTLGEISAYGF